MTDETPEASRRTEARPPDEWRLRQPFGPRAVAVAALIAIVLAFSAHRTQIDDLVVLSTQGLLDLVGIRSESQVGKGASRFFETAFPLALSEETPIARVEGFDRDDLPLFSRIETRAHEETVFDPAAGELVTRTESHEVLVRPGGYVTYVCAKMLESIEIAVWGTLLAIVLGAPLAFVSASGYAPHPAVRFFARGITSWLRAVPELVSALFLVLAFGFGPIPGVLALGLHSAGFIGKFFADDVENADRGPQEALRAVGAPGSLVFRFAVLPQVLPQYIAYTQYILERNVRMATVIGLVGAGGIGVELKGRFDMFDFGHVSTILVVIFITVFALERASSAVRARLI